MLYEFVMLALILFWFLTMFAKPLYEIIVTLKNRKIRHITTINQDRIERLREIQNRLREANRRHITALNRQRRYTEDEEDDEGKINTKGDYFY